MLRITDAQGLRSLAHQVAALVELKKKVLLLQAFSGML